ncbi:MAG: pentapeptide repeat-containing protein [Proteobacteria bacterium]|nr:pentapeptide repeat-containing protein [Pseudomonadota bacterium]
MTNANHPLSRTHLHTAFHRLMPRLSAGMRRLAEQLLELIGEDGSAPVQQLHTQLFPATDNTKTASAQLGNLLKALARAAEESGLVLGHQFEGSKQGTTAGRKLRFLGPPPLLLAETETLNAIEPEQRIQGQLADVLVQEHKVVLLTFNKHEFEAVRKLFWNKPSAQPSLVQLPLPGRPAISLDELGSLGNMRIFHHHSRQGNRESQRASADIQAALQPRAIVAVGIAFGINEKKQNLADVLVSKFIVDYELGKVHDDGKITLRGARPPASRAWVRALEQLDTRANAGIDKTTWPRLHFGGVLSGEKLVDHRDYRDQLGQLSGQDDIVGGEMEAAGVQTALDGTGTDWLVVKAICDWGDGNKSQDKERRQQQAADNAAQVVHALIASGTVYPEPASPTPDTPRPRLTPAGELMRRTRLPERDGDCPPYQPNHATHINLDSFDELADKRGRGVLGESEKASLVAFDDILQWATDANGPPLYALLGEYGMGKTTTSQRVFEHLRQQHAAGELARPALYFDLRKVERLVSASAVSPGAVPGLQETVEDCLKNGYLSDGLQAPSYADVLATVDQGAVVIFDGLDEVLSRIQDKQGLTFTANLLRVLPDAQARRAPSATAPPPKVLLSCRSQFFRTLREQSNHLTGEHRGAQPARQYRAVVLRPFTEEQIRQYLQAALPSTDVNELMARIASIHNLTELSQRPFTLKLISRFLPQIERWQAAGRTVTGATLYREVAREWLIRDREKQSFQPEDKERLAAALAAHLWQKNLRGLNAPALETWLGEWLTTQSTSADYQDIPRALLQQDLRNATFLRRVDDGDSSRFEFAHSSLQEFFLAEHLAAAVRQAAAESTPSQTQAAFFAAWAGPSISGETLDFLAQILSEHTDPAAWVAVLNRWRTSYRAQASELLLRYALQAPPSAPRPLLAGFDLRGAALRDWAFGEGDETDTTPLLPMQGVRLQGADLRGTRWRRVRLDDADVGHARLDQAVFQACSLRDSRWADAQLTGTVFRDCALAGSQLSSAQAYRAQFSGCTGVPDAVAQPADPATWLAPPTHPLAPSAPSGRLQWLSGHSGAVTAVAFSPNGQRIASASDDSTLCLWGASSGECLITFSVRQHSVSAVAFSPNGQRIASASHDRTLRLWDASSGECLITFSGHQLPVTAVAFSPNGQRIASASHDNTLRLWDALSGECLLTFSGHQDWITAVAFSPNGQRIASASDDSTLRLWDASSGECLLTFSGHQGWVNAVAFSPNGQRIASASRDGTLRLWDADSGRCLRSHWASDWADCAGHAVWSPPGAEAEHPEGRLISASGDAWRVLGWQVWDHPSAPGQWTRLPLGPYPTSPVNS